MKTVTSIPFPWLLASLFAVIVSLFQGCFNSADKKEETTMSSNHAPFMHGVNISHYLSQLGNREYARAGAFTVEDVNWLLARGYDHIRLPVDGPELMDSEGNVRKDRLEAIDQTIDLAHSHGLSVLLDMHELEGSTFSGKLDSRLFTEQALQKNARVLWEILARRYQHLGDNLRFGILNEPVAEESSTLTAFYAKVLQTIREISPERMIHLSPNRWARIENAPALEPLFSDANLVVEIHYYDPHVFTHQKASWVGMDVPGFPDIPFPGVVPDLTPFLPKDHYAYDDGGTELTMESIQADFQTLVNWAAKADIGVYIGEFGVYYPVKDAYKRNWYTAVLDQCRKHGIGWATWDYKGGFGVRDESTGEATIVQDILDDYID